MKDNDWKTQPRKDNGQFTFRYESIRKIIENLIEMDKNPNISKKYEGGNYTQLRKKYAGIKDIEIHHTPADSISPLSKNKGPCVAIEKEDHKETKSYKNSLEARQFRQKQKELINHGHFLTAEFMDFQNLILTFREKYARAMLEKPEYDKELYNKGEINE